MSLDDRDIFSAICNRYPDQPMEFIMAEYEKARNFNRQIELREAQETQCDSQIAPAMGTFGTNTGATAVEEAEAVPEKKRYNRRKLKVRPENAITEDVIYCCICGEPRQNLTVKHLAQHGFTVEEYKELCRYTPDQPLMSKKHLAHSREVVAKAQQARLSKKTQQESNFSDQPM